mgnify:CR=1 FL=1
MRGKLEQEMNAPEKMAETPSPKKTAGKKKKFRKNQVIITALAIMIAVAGYINYADSTLSTKEKADGTTADASTVLKDISSLDTDITDEVDAGTAGDSSRTVTETPGRGSPCRGIYIHGPGQNRPRTDPFPEQRHF